MQDLEGLLQERFELQDKTNILSNSSTLSAGQAVNMQRANGNCSIYDFFRWVGLISDNVLKKEYNATFMTDERNHILKDPDICMNGAYITYRLNKRVSTKEYKPVAREEVVDLDDSKRKGIIYGQTFDCYVQFNVFATNDIIANTVMDKFEELLLTYSGYLKENGIREMYFHEQLTDKDYNIFRETLSVRNFVYYVQIEKLTTVFNKSINDIIFTDDTDSQM